MIQIVAPHTHIQSHSHTVAQSHVPHIQTAAGRQRKIEIQIVHFIL